MATQLGKRYRCVKCGTEILCTKTATGKILRRTLREKYGKSRGKASGHTVEII